MTAIGYKGNLQNARGKKNLFITVKEKCSASLHTPSLHNKTLNLEQNIMSNNLCCKKLTTSLVSLELHQMKLSSL